MRLRMAMEQEHRSAGAAGPQSELLTANRDRVERELFEHPILLHAGMVACGYLVLLDALRIFAGAMTSPGGGYMGNATPAAQRTEMPRAPTTSPIIVAVLARA
jgi:hypothetical protein